jgi:hypothetical protein
VSNVATEQQVRGYVLEEILASLIKNSGYDLLPDASYDPQELEDQPNGLAVRGRGATHQADVLGQLTWVPAFTYPLRLFVEAKYYSERRVGLSVVRAAVGIIDDVNQNFQVVAGPTSPLLRKRYAYRYALFSATGFDAHAAEYAYAHEISLIDLSTPAFSPLREMVSSIASLMFPDGSGTGSLRLTDFRQGVRDFLNPELESAEPWGRVDLPQRVVEQLSLIRDRSGFSDLLIGVPDAPFVLVLQPDSLDFFLRYCREHPHHEVFINYTFGTTATEWELTPRGSAAYRLTFSLPPVLDEWILAVDNYASRNARHLKDDLLKSITIFWTREGRDELFKLEYSRYAAESQIRERHH